MSQKRGLRAAVKRLISDRSGVTAIEFALVGPPFFALIGATLETALVFFAGQALDTSINNSTRSVRMGIAQAQSLSIEQYRAQVCDGLYGMFDCEAIRIVLRPLDNFDAYARIDPVDRDNGEWQVENTFDIGEGSSVMVVEAYYKFPSILAIPGLTTGLLPDGTRLLATSRVFKNEPFA